MYVVALATGVLVGIIYALLDVRFRRRWALPSSACSAS
jgi:xanthosine utilization system XapX-like protein